MRKGAPGSNGSSIGASARPQLLEVRSRGGRGDAREQVLRTDRGSLECVFHPAPEGDGAVLWVGGAGGGLDGPAGGLYPRLAGRLVERRVSSLRLDYRRPNELVPCVLDVLVGIEHLRALGKHRVVLVGHSFGGAVVIEAGTASESVVAVAALSSQTYGTAGAGDLCPRPLLLLHGEADQVLPAACSRDIHRRARNPKRLLLYPGCGHGLDECRDEVDRDLLAWIEAVLPGGGREGTYAGVG